MSWVAVGTSAVSLLMQARGSKDAAAGARVNAERIAAEKRFEATQLRQQAGQSLAVSQVQAAEEQRRARLVQSRTLAVAAASGAGVSDPTMVNMLGKIAGEGTYRAHVALYGGEEKARLLRMQAAAADYEAAAGIEGGALRAGAYETKGAGDLLAGGSSLFAKFNAGGLFSSSPGTSAGGAPTSAGNFDFPGMT